MLINSFQIDLNKFFSNRFTAQVRICRWNNVYDIVELNGQLIIDTMSIDEDTKHKTGLNNVCSLWLII